MDELERTSAPLMRVTEVAAELGVRRERVYELINAGLLPYVRLSPRRTRVPRKSFELWLEVQNERAVQSITAPIAQPETEAGA